MQIDQAWDVFPDWGMYKRLYTPHKYYEDYIKATKNPYIIHYAGPGKPWDFPYNNFAEFFWKYAKNSLFWGIILENKIQTELSKKFSSIDADNSIHHSIPKACPLKKMADRFFPVGTRRRKIIKKIWFKN